MRGGSFRGLEAAECPRTLISHTAAGTLTLTPPYPYPPRALTLSMMISGMQPWRTESSTRADQPSPSRIEGRRKCGETIEAGRRLGMRLQFCLRRVRPQQDRILWPPPSNTSTPTWSDQAEDRPAEECGVLPRGLRAREDVDAVLLPPLPLLAQPDKEGEEGGGGR